MQFKTIFAGTEWRISRSVNMKTEPVYKLYQKDDMAQWVEVFVGKDYANAEAYMLGLRIKK